MPSSVIPFDPADYLHLAKELATDTTEEARLRCAVGRLYYAVFLTGRELFGLTNNKSDVHSALSYRARAKNGAMGGQLVELLRLRKVADYDLLPVETDSDWSKNYQNAHALTERVLQKFDQIRNDPDFPRWLSDRFPV